MSANSSTHMPTLTAREAANVGRIYARRFTRDPELPRAEYLARLYAIRAEVYPAKRYAGEPK